MGVLEEEAKAINKRFFTYHRKKRPYIILKWAQSSDGFIAPTKVSRLSEDPFWLTNEASQTLSHLWRSQEQSILVGVQTVVDDNPSLTTRKVNGNSPLRIVIDPKGRIPKESALLNDKNNTLVISSQKDDTIEEVVVLDFTLILEKLCSLLYNRNIQSVIIEGGSITLQAFIDSNLWDEARVFVTPSILKDGIKKPKLEGTAQESILIEEDRLDVFYSKY